MPSLINVKSLEDLRKLHEDEASIAVHLDKILCSLALVDLNIHIDKFVKEVVLKMCCLYHKFTQKPDQCQFDVSKIHGLVVILNDTEHLDEVEPVPWLLLVLINDKWLLKNELADQIHRVVLWMKHCHMKYFDNLIDEHSQETFVLEAEEGLAVVVSIVVQRMLYQEEYRLHELGCLDEQGCQLRVSLEGLEQEIKDGIQGHIHQVEVSARIWKIQSAFHLSENSSRLLAFDLDQSLDVEHLYQEGPIVELGQHWNRFLIIHLSQAMEQLQSQSDKQEWTVFIAQDLVDLRNQSLPIESLQQRLDGHLLDLFCPINIIDITIALASFAVLDESLTNFVEKLKHGDLDTIKLVVLEVSIDALMNHTGMALQEFVVEHLGE